MGGYGSGRWGGRPTVESGLTLNLPRLFKTGWLKPGAWTAGTLRWFAAGTDEETASMDFEARLGAEEALFASIGHPPTGRAVRNANTKTALR